MKMKQIGLALILSALVPAMAHAGSVPRYNEANIFVANSTVTLVPFYNASGGHLNGFKCIFPSNALGASVKVQSTIDGTASNFIIDPTNLEQDSTSRFVSGWIPYNISFTTSLQVTLNNTGLGTANIYCWASWDTP
jgi:hypothetical protein